MWLFRWINSIISISDHRKSQEMVVSASTNQVWTKITIRTYTWSFGHSDPDPSRVYYFLKIAIHSFLFCNNSIDKAGGFSDWYSNWNFDRNFWSFLDASCFSYRNADQKFWKLKLHLLRKSRQHQNSSRTPIKIQVKKSDASANYSWKLTHTNQNHYFMLNVDFMKC